MNANIMNAQISMTSKVIEVTKGQFNVYFNPNSRSNEQIFVLVFHWHCFQAKTNCSRVYQNVLSSCIIICVSLTLIQHLII